MYNGYCSPTTSANFVWDTQTTKRGLALGEKLRIARSRPQPRKNSVSLELYLGYLPPANPAGGHSFDCVLHGSKPHIGLGHDLGETSASPEHGFGLDITNERAPNITKSNRVDVLPGAFRHTHHCSNHYDLDNFPIRRARVRDGALGSLRSQRCKYRNRTSSSRHKSNNEYKGHTGYRGSTMPPHRARQTPAHLKALLEAINRDIQDFKQGGKHFTVFSSTTILALASINPRDLGSFPLPTSLYSLL
jgi:hypothetical protein